MKTVYRIEHISDGKGLWHSRDEKDCIRFYKIPYEHQSSFFDKTINLPGFYRDTEISSRLTEEQVQDYKFAFNSLEDVFIFLTEETLNECFKIGFKLLKLIVVDYVESRYQTVFKDPIKVEDISELYHLEEQYNY